MHTSTRTTQLAWQRQCDDIGTSIDCRLLARQGEGERMRSSELQGRESYPQHRFPHAWRVSAAILGVPGGGGERDGALKNVAAAIGGGRTSGPRATSRQHAEGNDPLLLLVQYLASTLAGPAAPNSWRVERALVRARPAPSGLPHCQPMPSSYEVPSGCASTGYTRS